MSSQGIQDLGRWDHVSVRRSIGLFVALVVAASVASSLSPPASANPAQHQILFPVAQEDIDGLRWSDTWGAPRSGGRSHIGVDLLGEKMMKLVAVRDSTVTWGRFDNGRGSIVKLRDSDGWEYQYIHLNNDTPGTDDGRATCENVLSAKLCAARDGSGLTKGTTVSAGEFIGYLGDSGNAEWTTPHLHFEIYQPDGRAVNPTPYVDAAIDRADVASGTESGTDSEELDLEKHSSDERDLARTELEADVVAGAAKISVRLNGRTGSESEVQAIAEVIESEGLEQALADVVETNPAVAMIDRLYLTFFQRFPDDDGLNYWLTAIGEGANVEDVAEWFAMSDEFQRRYQGRDFGQFLDKLYVDVLNREPDAKGKVYWLDQLETRTVTRGTIVVYFTEGEELVRAHQYRTELTVAHRALGLSRPTVGEVDHWRAERAATGLVEALAAWLQTS